MCFKLNPKKLELIRLKLHLISCPKVNKGQRIVQFEYIFIVSKLIVFVFDCSLGHNIAFCNVVAHQIAMSCINRYSDHLQLIKVSHILRNQVLCLKPPQTLQVACDHVVYQRYVQVRCRIGLRRKSPFFTQVIAQLCLFDCIFLIH